MQQKTTQLANTAKLGLNVSKDKAKIMRINNTIDGGVVLDGGILEDVDSFTYQGSVIAKNGGADKDIKTRIGKARSAFLVSQSTKFRMLRPYYSITAKRGNNKLTKATTHRLQTFINKCL